MSISCLRKLLHMPSCPGNHYIYLPVHLSVKETIIYNVLSRKPVKTLSCPGNPHYIFLNVQETVAYVFLSRKPLHTLSCPGNYYMYIPSCPGNNYTSVLSSKPLSILSWSRETRTCAFLSRKQETITFHVLRYLYTLLQSKNLQVPLCLPVRRIHITFLSRQIIICTFSSIWPLHFLCGEPKIPFDQGNYFTFEWKSSRIFEVLFGAFFVCHMQNFIVVLFHSLSFGRIFKREINFTWK
jgi:hypothetical protein